MAIVHQDKKLSEKEMSEKGLFLIESFVFTFNRFTVTHYHYGVVNDTTQGESNDIKKSS